MVSYYRTHLISLFIFGVRMIPIENEFLKHLYKAYAFVFVGMVIYMYTFLEGIGLIEVTDNMSQFTFQLCYWITHVLGAVKTTIILWKKDDIVELISKLENGIFAPNIQRGGAIEIELVKSANNYSLFQLWEFYFVVVLILACRVSYVIVNNGVPTELYDLDLNISYVSYTRETPYACWAPFDVTKSPMYEMMSTYQIMSYFTQGMHIGALDAIICGCMMHMASQFMIVKGSLDSITSLTESYNELGTPCLELDEAIASTVHNRVVECVKHHQKILAFCEEIEDKFSFLMLLQFISSLLSICFILFQLSVTDIHSFAFYSMAAYICLMTGQIFFYCYAGNEVMWVSDLFCTYIFHCKWMLTKQITKRYLLLMMTRAQRPTKFTAGKFSVLSLQTFVTILRASFSYFMVLRQTNSS